ncbi:MAG: hypothetical protein AAF809_15615 [Bacteroidota bacterium]
MGRGLLLAVVATSLLVTFSTSRSTQNIVALAGDQSEYGADVLAREIARSGYEVAYRAAERGQGPGGTLADAIDAVNTIAADRPFQGGTWSAEAHAIDSLSALIRVTGTYAAESYTTEGVYDASVLAPPASPHPGPPLSPDWKYDCTASRYVEMYTTGLGTYGSYVPSATITIPDPGSVVSIKAQATVKFGQYGNVPQMDFATDNGQTASFTAPTTDDVGNWFYTVDFEPATSVTVTPTVVRPYDRYGPRSFTLFVVRDRPGVGQGGGLVELDVWSGTLPEVSKTIEIPAAPSHRDVTVTFALGDTSGGRWWEMSATAGPISDAMSTSDANMGAQAAQHQLLLRNVPGYVTEVEATVRTQGESLFYKGVTASASCNP